MYLCLYACMYVCKYVWHMYMWCPLWPVLCHATQAYICAQESAWTHTNTHPYKYICIFYKHFNILPLFPTRTCLICLFYDLCSYYTIPYILYIHIQNCIFFSSGNPVPVALTDFDMQSWSHPTNGCDYAAIIFGLNVTVLILLALAYCPSAYLLCTADLILTNGYLLWLTCRKFHQHQFVLFFLFFAFFPSPLRLHFAWLLRLKTPAFVQLPRRRLVVGYCGCALLLLLLGVVSCWLAKGLSASGQR